MATFTWIASTLTPGNWNTPDDWTLIGVTGTAPPGSTTTNTDVATFANDVTGSGTYVVNVAAGNTFDVATIVSAQPAWSTDPPRRMARMAWCALMPRRAAVPTTDLMVANRSAPQFDRKPPVTLR